MFPRLGGVLAKASPCSSTVNALTRGQVRGTDERPHAARIAEQRVDLDFVKKETVVGPRCPCCCLYGAQNRERWEREHARVAAEQQKFLDRGLKEEARVRVAMVRVRVGRRTSVVEVDVDVLARCYRSLDHLLRTVTLGSHEAKLETQPAAIRKPEAYTLLPLPWCMSYFLSHLLQVCAEMAQEERATKAFNKWELVRMLQEKRHMANEEIETRYIRCPVQWAFLQRNTLLWG